MMCMASWKTHHCVLCFSPNKIQCFIYPQIPPTFRIYFGIETTNSDLEIPQFQETRCIDSILSTFLGFAKSQVAFSNV